MEPIPIISSAFPRSAPTGKKIGYPIRLDQTGQGRSKHLKYMPLGIQLKKAYGMEETDTNRPRIISRVTVNNLTSERSPISHNEYWYGTLSWWRTTNLSDWTANALGDKFIRMALSIPFRNSCLGLWFDWVDTTKEDSFSLASLSLLYHPKNWIQERSLSIPLRIHSCLSTRAYLHSFSLPTYFHTSNRGATSVSH